MHESLSSECANFRIVFGRPYAILAVNTHSGIQIWSEESVINPLPKQQP